jgi:hypothetical protein
MPNNANPVVLELASLPREQIGPFFLLGVPKEADQDQIERHWVDRVKWCLQNKVKLSREDVNWAHEMLKDLVSRVRSDVSSLNVDTSEGVLLKLAQRYGSGEQGRLWQPLDSEKPLAEYSPAAEVPTAESVRSALTVPEVPEELPALAQLLDRLAQTALDPWTVELPR